MILKQLKLFRLTNMSPLFHQEKACSFSVFGLIGSFSLAFLQSLLQSSLFFIPKVDPYSHIVVVKKPLFTLLHCNLLSLFFFHLGEDLLGSLISISLKIIIDFGIDKNSHVVSVLQQNRCLVDIYFPGPLLLRLLVDFDAEHFIGVKNTP